MRLREAGDICIYRSESFCGYQFIEWIYSRLKDNHVCKPGTDHKSQIDILKSLEMDLKGDNDEKWVVNLRRDFEEIKARATEALHFLDRAEPLLQHRRRNVWWTTWYFERRLRAMSYLLWSSVVDGGKPIPFLGLEAAARLTDTIADRILEDASRMIRVDSYRFAMVVLEYASCARALRVRLTLDDTTVWLPERLLTMKRNLNQALAQLGVVTSLRNGDRLKGTLPDSFHISTYVDEVIDAATAVATSVETDLGVAKRNDRDD